MKRLLALASLASVSLLATSMPQNQAEDIGNMVNTDHHYGCHHNCDEPPVGTSNTPEPATWGMLGIGGMPSRSSVK